MNYYFPKLTKNETIFGFIYFLLQLIVVPGILLAVAMMLPGTISEAQVNFLFFLVNFLAVLLIFRNYLKANFPPLQEKPWHVLRWAGIGFVIYMAGNALFSLLVTPFFPEFANINDASIQAMVQDNYTLMTVGTVLLVPVAEECFYRGLLFRNLYEKKPILAYTVSMVLFSLAHVLGYVTMVDFTTLLLCFLQYLPAGFALALSYRRSGTIYASILIHMAVNQAGMLLMR